MEQERSRGMGSTKMVDITLKDRLGNKYTMDDVQTMTLDDIELDFKLAQLDMNLDNRGLGSIRVKGKDISDHINEISISVKAGRMPFATLKFIFPEKSMRERHI